MGMMKFLKSQEVYMKQKLKSNKGDLAAVSFTLDIVPVVSNLKDGWEASVEYYSVTGD